MKTKVVKIYEQGSVDVLKIEETDLREINLNEVLIKHEYAGLNFIDINQRKGTYPLKKLPSIMGMEASGTIIQIGSNVTRFNIGDKVTHCMNLGSFSSIMLLPESKVIKLRQEIDLKVAAAATLQGLTAQYLIHESYVLKKNNTILMHAAAGGVGQILCQWANKIGAKVIGTVSTKEKEKIAKENGCHFTINYQEENFKDKIMAITKDNGVDVIYDSVGKDTFSIGLKCLAPKGRLVSFGVSSGSISPIDINSIRSFSGSIATGGLNTFIKEPNEMQKNADKLFDMIYNKKIKVNIEKIIPIEDIKNAQYKMENRLTTGSVILSF
jgi:NADPH2:quinone reductase|tara:strand:- start:126 stop:1100 length:975 start_codon:yes stop_codon:yes gene_type:complete